MKNVPRIFAFCLLGLGCAFGQMTVISTPQKDPEVKPEQLTATIVHYERMRLIARKTMSMLALALQNTDGGSKLSLIAAINNEQDIVDSANWCIQALRDKTADALACAFPTGLNDGAPSEGVCQIANSSVVRMHCSQQTTAKRTEATD